MLIFSEVLTMKHTFKTLLGLVLVVLFLAGCSNPAGPETPEVNEPPVVETPEENVKLVKVEFRWSKYPDVGAWKGGFEKWSPLYLSELRLNSDPDLNAYKYAYGLPEGCNDISSYIKFTKEEGFEKFSNNVFEKNFGTKYCKEGEEIDLTKWTSRAIFLPDISAADCLHFSFQDKTNSKDVIKDPFDKIVVGNEDIIVYIFYDSGISEYADF